jgi:hypothetical protein
MFPFALSLALRFPKIASFLKNWGKYILVALAIGAAFFIFQNWKHDLQKASFNKGFEAAEKKCSEAVEKSNKVVVIDNEAMTTFSVTATKKVAKNKQEIRSKVDPVLEEIRSEVASVPTYHSCAISDGMLNNINAAGSAVNRAIDPGNSNRD